MPNADNGVVEVRLQSMNRGAGQVLLEGLDESGRIVCLMVVACPMWYFGNNPGLTCLFPPEAAAVLQREGFPPVNPDCMMR